MMIADALVLASKSGKKDYDYADKVRSSKKYISLTDTVLERIKFDENLDNNKYIIQA